MEAHNSVIESTLESDETEPVTQVGLDTAITTNALTISKDEPYVMNVGASINAMSSDPALSKVVVAGREVLKIYSTDTLGEVLNIRVGKINMNYSSNDVRWNPNQSHSQYIASAATNGAVVIWNLGSKGKKLGMQILSSMFFKFRSNSSSLQLDTILPLQYKQKRHFICIA